MTLTYLWHREDDTTTPILVTFAPAWSTPAVTWRSPDRCHEAEGEALEITGFACGDVEALAEFEAEYAAEADLRELVAMECEREGESWRDSYSSERGWAEWNEE